MNLRIITDDDIFKIKLIELKEYFNQMMRKGPIPPLYEDAYKPLKTAYDVVFNDEVLYGKQKKTATFWPLRDNYSEGDSFLNSETGVILQEVVYYFAHKYQIPHKQLGGYNISVNPKQ